MVMNGHFAGATGLCFSHTGPVSGTIPTFVHPGLWAANQVYSALSELFRVAPTSCGQIKATGRENWSLYIFVCQVFPVASGVLGATLTAMGF